MPSIKPLAPSFYNRSPQLVAQRLLGKILLHATDEGLTAGRIVETEAYLSSNDPACHANRGMTKRNRTMFGKFGNLYVYTIHAKYCLNAVTQREGLGSAVLIRALEPLTGIELMQQRRGYTDLRKLCRGPAMLCQALAIDLTQDGLELDPASGVWIGRDTRQRGRLPVATSPRIGISQATDLMLRYFVPGSPFISGTRKLNELTR